MKKIKISILFFFLCGFYFFSCTKDVGKLSSSSNPADLPFVVFCYTYGCDTADGISVSVNNTNRTLTCNPHGCGGEAWELCFSIPNNGVGTYYLNGGSSYAAFAPNCPLYFTDAMHTGQLVVDSINPHNGKYIGHYSFNCLCNTPYITPQTYSVSGTFRNF